MIGHGFLAKAETFVRIVETGSFSGAGRSLGLSLAAISRQMAALETELAAKLLLRTTRSLSLTDEGRRFHEHANRLLRDAEAARASVRPEGAISGNVVLSASVSLGILRIVPNLPKLFATHPALELTLRLEDRSADLVSEGVDIAVALASICRTRPASSASRGYVCPRVGRLPRLLAAPRHPAQCRRAGRAPCDPRLGQLRQLELRRRRQRPARSRSPRNCAWARCSQCAAPC
ncbi:MAG: LysR family transcriptional regulator [Pseudomonadota bacterium]